MNIAKKKKRNPRWAQMRDQSVRGGAVVVAVEDMAGTIYLSDWNQELVTVVGMPGGTGQSEQVKCGKRSKVHGENRRENSDGQGTA